MSRKLSGILVTIFLVLATLSGCEKKEVTPTSISHPAAPLITDIVTSHIRTDAVSEAAAAERQSTHWEPAGNGNWEYLRWTWTAVFFPISVYFWRYLKERHRLLPVRRDKDKRG